MIQLLEIDHTDGSVVVGDPKSRLGVHELHIDRDKRFANLVFHVIDHGRGSALAEASFPALREEGAGAAEETLVLFDVRFPPAEAG